MTEPRRTSLLWIVLATLFFAVVAFNVAYGSPPPENTGDISVTGGDVLGGDVIGGDLLSTVNTSISMSSSNPVSVSTGGNKALAFSNNLGSVRIADCLGSTQFGTPIFSRQKLTLNQVCMAEFYMGVGKYDLAAMSLCNIPEILKEFDDEAACEAAHDFTVAIPEPLPTVTDHDVMDEWRAEQTAVQVSYDELLHATEARIVKLEERLSRPRTVQAAPKPWMTDEKRAKLEAVLAE